MNGTERTVATSSGNIGFCGLLTIVFIVLKLTDVIGWSWWWVLSPLWIPTAFLVAVALLLFGIYLILRLFESPADRALRDYGRSYRKR